MNTALFGTSRSFLLLVGTGSAVGLDSIIAVSLPILGMFTVYFSILAERVLERMLRVVNARGSQLEQNMSIRLGIFTDTSLGIRSLPRPGPTIAHIMYFVLVMVHIIWFVLYLVAALAVLKVIN